MILNIQTDRSWQTVDKDETEEAVWSGSLLFAIPSESFGCITIWYKWIQVAWLSTEYDVARRILKFLGKTWEFWATSRQCHSQ